MIEWFPGFAVPTQASALEYKVLCTEYIFTLYTAHGEQHLDSPHLDSQHRDTGRVLLAYWSRESEICMAGIGTVMLRRLRSIMATLKRTGPCGSRGRSTLTCA